MYVNSTPTTFLHPRICAALSSYCVKSGNALYITVADIVAEKKEKLQPAMLP